MRCNLQYLLVDCIFSVDTASSPKVQKLALEERDTMLGTIYRQPRVLVLRHNTQKNNQGAEVVIYTIKKYVFCYLD